MGLDMYLNKRTYIGANYEHNNVKGVVYLTKGGEQVDIKINRITEITENIGYWRKANQIHAWFVANVQGGVDDCQEAYVSVEKLKELLGICKTVVKSPSLANELLPPSIGFFFGSYAIDDNYINQIKDTIDILEIAIQEKGGDFYYRSSW